MSPRQLTTAAGCYVITAAILLPVICCLVTEATRDAEENNGSPTASHASVNSAIFESSPLNSNASRPSVLGIPTTPVIPGSRSTHPETKSFRELPAELASPKAYADDIEKTESKVTKVNDTGRDSFTSRNDTPSSVDVIWTTASHAEVKLRSTETEQIVQSQEDSSNWRSRPKVTSGSETGSETGSRTDLRKTAGFFSAVIGGSCCGTSDVQTTTTTDNYDYNNYNDEDDDDDENNDENGDETDKEVGDAESRDDAYGYSDRGDESQTYEDYRGGGGGMMDGEDGDGGGGGSDESRTEYLYVSDNFTSNDSQVASENQELQQDSNSEYDDYNPSSDQSRDQPDNGQQFRGSLAYEAESRDYHLGVEQHALHLGEKISEMRGVGHRGQTISLRWLEHHPINHFAVFLWLVAALAFVSILLLAYRFRHSVINSIQCTRVNYKQGKRFGIEEANDLLSNAQV